MLSGTRNTTGERCGGWVRREKKRRQTKIKSKPPIRRTRRNSEKVQQSQSEESVGVVEVESLEWKVGGKGRGVFVDMTRMHQVSFRE